MVFKYYFVFERTWWRLFQNRTVCINLISTCLFARKSHILFGYMFVYLRDNHIFYLAKCLFICATITYFIWLHVCLFARQPHILFGYMFVCLDIIKDNVNKYWNQGMFLEVDKTCTSPWAKNGQPKTRKLNQVFEK